MNKHLLSKLRDHRYNQQLNKGYHNRQIVVPIFENIKLKFISFLYEKEKQNKNTQII